MGSLARKLDAAMTLLLLYQVQITTPLTVSILSSVAPWPSRFISFSINTGQPRRLVGLRVERAKMLFSSSKLVNQGIQSSCEY